MVAPAVDVDNVTVCAVAYVPAPGENDGVPAVNVYVAPCTLDVAMPAIHALAFNVVVWVMETVPPDATVGSVSTGSSPLVV